MIFVEIFWIVSLSIETTEISTNGFKYFHSIKKWLLDGFVYMQLNGLHVIEVKTRNRSSASLRSAQASEACIRRSWKASSNLCLPSQMCRNSESNHSDISGSLSITSPKEDLTKNSTDLTFLWWSEKLRRPALRIYHYLWSPAKNFILSLKMFGNQLCTACFLNMLL